MLICKPRDVPSCAVAATGERMRTEDTTSRILDRLARLQVGQQNEEELAADFQVLLTMAGGQAFFICREDGRQWLPPPWRNIPKDFAEAYAALATHGGDILIQVALRTHRPVLWRAAWNAAPTPSARKAADVFNSFGFADGVTVPVAVPPRQFDLVGIALPVEVTAHAPLVSAIAFACQTVWWKSAEARGEPTPGPLLTPREAQVLQWIRQGKSNRDIGTITDLSERAVEFHVANVLRKLDAGSKLVAVLNAIRLGLLPL